MNVQAGDLAYIIDAMLPENVGRVVLVVRFLGDTSVLGGTDYWWEVEMVGAPGRNLGGEVTKVGDVRDRNLRRISGPTSTESTDEQLTKPVVQLESELA